MVVVTGPRIDPASVPAPRGRRGAGATSPTCTGMLAACDVAVVQGGLTTTMELTAPRPPVPLLPAAPPLRAELPRARTGSTATVRARACTTTPRHPESIGEAIAAELDRPVAYRPVPTDGARRAAALIAELV